MDKSRAAVIKSKTIDASTVLENGSPEQGDAAESALELVPLTGFKAPAISPDILPGWLKDYSLAVVEHMQVPFELVLANVLGVAATVLARKFEVLIKPGYLEPLNLYILAPMEPAERKSGTQSLCVAPLIDWEREQARQLKDKIIEARSRRESLEAIIKGKQGKLAKTEPGKQEALIKEIAQLQKELPTIPHEPRLIADDITPEATASLMAANFERIGVISAEGGLFDTLAGRYSSGIPNLDLFLKGHSRDPVRVDRKGGSPVIMNSPALTLCLSPQPDVMMGLAKKPGFRGRGLLARFLYVVPVSMVGRRKIDTPPVPDQLAVTYRQNVQALLDTPWALNEFGEQVSHVLKLEPAAFGDWVKFSQAVEAELNEGGKFEIIKDWAGKLPGQAGRLAGILHCLKNLGEAARHPITQATMGQALELGTVFIAQALDAFGMIGADSDIEAAKRVLSWIRREHIEGFAQRDCHRALLGTYSRVDKIRAALSVLEERGYIQPLDAGSAKGPGRPPSPQYRVNPLAHKGDF